MDTKLEKWCSEKSQPLNGYRACQNLSIDLSVEMVFGVHLATSHHSMLFDAAKTFVDNLFCFPVSLPGNGKWKVRIEQRLFTYRPIFLWTSFPVDLSTYGPPYP